MACDIIDSYAIATFRDQRKPRVQLSRRLHARSPGRADRAGPARRRPQGDHEGAHRPPCVRGMRDRRRIAFLDPQSIIPRTQITVQDARDGKFIGSEIPNDLERQWIQGTGPAARPGATVEIGLRNIAYALLSGADGWMFDGEDALGQVSTMSLDNQRNLKLAIHRDPVFLKVAEQVTGEMNTWAKGFFGRETIADWQKQLDFTTKIFRARGLHLDDRHVRHTGGESFSASIVDLVLYVDQQPAASADVGLVGGALSAEDSDRGRSRAVERHADDARASSRSDRRHDQGLRAGRTDRSVLPVDGNPRRTRARTSSASTPAAGTTSTACRTRWPGNRTS